MKALEKMGVAAMTPENTPSIIADIARIPSLAGFKEELLQGRRVKIELAKQRQVLMAQANAKIERRFMEGLGAMVLNVDRDLAAHFRLQHGFGCLSDPHFRKWLLKNHPECAVKCIGKMMVRVDGFREGGRQTSPGAGGAHGAQPVRASGPRGEPATPILAGPEKPRRASMSGHETMPAGARTRLPAFSKRLELAPGVSCAR